MTKCKYKQNEVGSFQLEMSKLTQPRKKNNLKKSTHTTLCYFRSKSADFDDFDSGLTKPLPKIVNYY